MEPTGQLWIPYCGPASLPSDWLTRWNLDPVVLVLFLVAILAWRAAPSRRTNSNAFYAGVAALFLLFVSPLCALTSALFAARVVHHVVLVAVAAPLIVWALPRAGVLGSSLAAWTAVHALVFWAWHYPPLYVAALSNDAVYWLMQASLFITALGFWSAIRSTPAPSAIAALLAMMVQMGLLAALITFAPAPLYPPHFATTAPWGLSPVEDQQLAGLIMWAPSAAFYLLAAMALVWRWLGADNRAAADA